MREKRIQNLIEKIGKGIIVKENKKSRKKRDDLFLTEIIELLCELESKTNVAKKIGIGLFELEERYIMVIKNLLDRIYGEEKTNIILWWVYESLTADDKVLPLKDKNEKEHIIETPKQLVKFLKQYDEK